MNSATCVKCLEKVDVRDTQTALLSPCCETVWIHRLCLEKSYDQEENGFKCSACLCKSEFSSNVNSEKAQSVTSVDNEEAEEDDDDDDDVPLKKKVKTDVKCSVDNCLCDEGPSRNDVDTEWEILACHICQVQGTHRRCSNLETMASQWQCAVCEEVSVKIEVEVDFPFGSAIEASVSLNPKRKGKIVESSPGPKKIQCTVKKCIYEGGRAENCPDTEWEIMVCNACLTQATHKQCLGLPLSTKGWSCAKCRKLSGQLRRKIRDIVGPISEYSLKKHKRSANNDETGGLHLPLEGVDVILKPYKCDFPDCTAEFIQSSLLKRHQRVHTGEKPFKCDYADCKAEFTQLSTLQRHHRVHTGEKPYKCEYINCDAAFSNSDGFKRHQLTHTGEKPYKCVYFNCDAAFSYRTVFKRHQLIHTGEKPYKCEFEGCDSVFARSSTLTQHRRKHTGEKPYKCNYEGCTASYKHTFDLKTHRRKHTGERPFTCEFCSASFNCRKALKLHYRVHSDERPFKCVYDGCDSAYKKPDTLKKHKEKHMAENPYYSLNNYNNFQAVIAGMTAFKTNDDDYQNLHHPSQDIT